MKYKLFVRLLCGIIGLVSIGACATSSDRREDPPPPSSAPPSTPQSAPRSAPPPVLETKTGTLVPVTRAIIERAGMTPENMKGIQFYIFGRLALEREETQLSGRIESGGNLIFEDVHNKEQIVFSNQTPGICVAMSSDGSQTTLELCFDDDEQLYRLIFKKDHSNSDEYFYLVHDLKTRNSDEKGSLVYGEKEYRVKYSGEKPPFLLVNLEQKDIEQPYTRTVRERLVETSAGESSED